MKTVLKFTRIGLLFLSVIAMAFVAGVILFPHHNRPPPKIVDDPFSSMLWIVIPAVWMSGPFWFGYLIVRRKTADMPSIGLAVGLILPYLYYLLFRPRGGISAVMTILSIPILAIVSGLCLAGLVCLARLVSRQQLVLIVGLIIVGVIGLVGWDLMRSTANSKKEYPINTPAGPHPRTNRPET